MSYFFEKRDIFGGSAMKKLLLLGGSDYLLPYIEIAHKLGLYVITCDYLPDNIAHKYSDEYCNVSIVDKESVLKAAEKLDIDGIMSPATDPGVTTCAWVAEHLGLPGCPSKSVDILQHKDLFRRFLSDHNFAVPYSEGFSSAADACKGAEKFKFPFIVKPTDSAGSKGVTRIDRYEQIADAVNLAFENSLTHHIIIEDFVEKVGNSSDTDSFSINSDLVFCSFNSQLFDINAANPYTPSAYVWPSDMPAYIQTDIRSEIQRLISLLNLGTSTYNIETRMGKDGRGYIMECSPRAGGNRLAEVLKYACGQDLITNAVKAALGMKLEPMRDPVYSGIWAEYIVHSNFEGKYKNILIDPEFEKKHVFEKTIWFKEGEHVYRFTGANRAIGTLILQFDSYLEAEEALLNIEKYVRVVLE